MDEAGLQMTFSCAPVLTYRNARSAPVLGKHHFRLGLIHFGQSPGATGNNRDA
jgi:hypothetical protein